MANVLYRPILKDILLSNFKLAPAVFFYLIYAAGIVVFAVSPALRSGNWLDAALMGGMFGLVAYATYDLTNHATLKSWDVKITLIDIAWGTIATSAVATAGYFSATFAERVLR